MVDLEEVGLEEVGLEEVVVRLEVVAVRLTRIQAAMEADTEAMEEMILSRFGV